MRPSQRLSRKENRRGRKLREQIRWGVQRAPRDKRRQDARQLGPQETQSLPHRNTSLQQEGADLIDDAGTLTDQSFAHTMQRLQVELLGGLRGDELHGRALHRLGDRLRITEVVLLSL